MEDVFFKPGRIAIILGTAAFITAMPFQVELGSADGILTVKSSQALAKSGDDDGDDDKGGSGGSGGGDDDDDDDNSGSGGSGDDDDDSNDDDSDDSDDDSSDDDSSDDSSSDGSSSSSGGTTGGSSDGVGVSKIEVSSSGVEVEYSDGTKEEIENGRYERKNSAGRTVEERPATQADIDRLMNLN